MFATKDLVGKAVIAILVTKIETSVGILILDVKLETNAAGAWAHGLHLSRSEVAREHATVVVASILDEAPSFLLVGPGWTGGMASRSGTLDAKRKYATQGSKHRASFHSETIVLLG